MTDSEAVTRPLPARLRLSAADTQPLHATQVLRRDEVEAWGTTTPSLAPATPRPSALGSCGRCLRLVLEGVASSCPGCGGLLHESCHRGCCAGCAAARPTPEPQPAALPPQLSALALGAGSLILAGVLGPVVLALLALAGVALARAHHHLR